MVLVKIIRKKFNKNLVDTYTLYTLVTQKRKEMKDLELKARKLLSNWAVKKLRAESELIHTVSKRGRYDINELTKLRIHNINRNIDTCKLLGGL